MTIAGVIIVAVGSYLFGNLIGYLVHRALHAPWMGRPYEDHYHHHWKIYPPEDFLSEEYRHPPEEAEQAKYYVPAFLLACMPLLAIHWGYFVEAAILSITVLKVNAMVHDALHIRGHWLERFSWFLVLREIHVNHHVDPSTNLGIFSFFADRLFRSYSGRNKDAPTK